MNKFSPFLAGCRALLAASLPNRCLLCHQRLLSASSGICDVCLQSCLYQTPVCLGCGLPLTTPCRYCGSCLSTQPIPVVAPASYHSLLGPLIPQIKYHAQFAALPPLVKALADRVTQALSDELIILPQVLVPVPLHPHRLRQRGFNQATVIAKLLGQYLQLPVDEQLVQRQTETLPQAGLDGQARRSNLQGAFLVTQAVSWQRIALIDDVVTTGTTINELARSLSPWTPDLQVWCLARAEAPGM
ncbi:double zinc ribbon domain-containing protein [Shewanella sp. A32]|uniref:ComF family protein n=1 Tax=Shewanella sp. A32 TaxID=3031327 RepID=UPI0023B97026|nr:double zinc ribbon domain-containing protein [Shewanella sp. A32]MDF0534660.1 double zinc ribbon domain-containing protein [Shewanella sp. A32]